jgi:hypothetical protein
MDQERRDETAARLEEYRRRGMFVEGCMDDRYRRGERPDMREPKGRGLPDTGGRTMKVVTSWALGASLQAEAERRVAEAAAPPAP